MQSTACPSPSHTLGPPELTPPTARPRRGWPAEVGQNLLLLSLSVIVTAAVTVVGHLTLNLVS